MVLDQSANFVRDTVTAAVSQGDTTISVSDATVFPDPSNGNYNLVIWDVESYRRPDLDPDVEIIRVTGRDTGTDELTVTRAQESTSDVAHPDDSALHLSVTEKLINDIDTEFSNIDTELSNKADITHAANHFDGGSDELDAADLAGALGSASQFLRSDGSAAAWATIDHTELTNVLADQHHAQDQSANYKDGGSFEIDAAEFAGALGTDGQVLKSDGQAANWETPGGASNIPNWVEDGNSPFTYTDVATDFSGTLANTGHDQYKFTISVYGDGTTDNSQWDMEISGVTTNDYYYIRIDGTTANNDSFIINNQQEAEGLGGELLFTTLPTPGSVAVDSRLQNGGSYMQDMDRGTCTATSDVTSFTITPPDGTNLTGTIEVLYRDL